ncbi:AEC family transporter [Franzmannia qiaohouensis]|uniref:AEC family transporter n=1 Tax=Franzmannia qiaohouensis TaxID=1329370 RepID=A0ABU1HFU5_9GAMM|nr:AEC family transporter [Halomonas qiaohouensis]MDR5905719.1 AEC family transporter [Halomonas qiaohouensis]
MNLFDVFLATLNITLPVFAMVLVGLVLKRIGWIDQAFIATASALVFKATMPTLLFLSIVQADLDTAFQPGLIAYFLGFTLLSFVLAWGWAVARYPRLDRGIFVQGAFRSNCGVVGLALAASMYGGYGLSLGGILTGGVIVLYNVLSSIILSLYSPTARSDISALLADIVRNPLILCVFAALPVAALGISLPNWLLTSGEYFGSLSLPLALICIGGTLSVRSIRSGNRLVMSVCLWKLVWVPLLGTLGAILLGYRGQALGVLFLFLASPTAAVAFIMAKAAGANDRLTADMIVLSTLASMLTVSLGIFVLQWFEMI